MPRSSIPEIVKFLNVLLEPDQTIEVRILSTRKGTVSGYYRNEIDRLAADAAEWSGVAAGVYITLNPANPALLSRSANRLKEYAKQTTSDADIVKRRWLPIDFDPVRPAGISSTDEEHQWAMDRAIAAAAWLRDETGFPEGILADSGNGAHLLYRVDLPNTVKSTALIKRCLEALDLKFTDDKVAVDVTCFNAARIWKLYGTMAGKGDNTQDRPHRGAKIIILPTELKVIE